MALVRCPTHKIPYNEENPRGCPACAREKEGDKKTLAQELAKAQQATRKPALGKKASVPATQPARPPSRTSVTARPHPLAVTTTHPKPPTAVEPGPIAKAWQQVMQIPFTLMAGVVIVILVAILVLTSGPRFTAAADPNLVADADLRPLPVDPNQPITVAFAALGTRAPQANPDDASLFRYGYGSDLIIDALNTSIYAITIQVPNRTWHGLRVGLDEQRARGELALLGSPEQAGNDGGAPAETHGGYVTYPASDSRPRRTLVVQVRPPNGCYDVTVDLRPQIVGAVDDGNERFYAVTQEGGSPNWVVTQIRIVSRSMRGPYATGTAC